MSIDLVNKAIVIWGTALEAVKCMYDFEHKGIGINCFFNSNCKISDFKGYNVFEPHKEKAKNSFIVVATTLEAYMSISSILNSWGLNEFDDYIYYEWIDKKLVLVHGNCYTDYIKKVLTETKEFNKKYFLYPNLMVHENYGGEISENVLKRVDVWVHQNITENNLFSYKLSDVYIKEYINPVCEEIVIPNFMGLVFGLFLQYEDIANNGSNHVIRNGEDINGMFPFFDAIIEKALEASWDFDEIYKLCIDENMFSEEYIQEKLAKWVDKIAEREKRWDIKILDYILDNYKKELLFYDINHPAEKLMDEIIDRLLKRMGIDEYKGPKEDSNLYVHEIPVYPCVRKALDLKWSKEYIREGKYGKRATDKMDLKEYIREYIWWRHGKML